MTQPVEEVIDVLNTDGPSDGRVGTAFAGGVRPEAPMYDDSFVGDSLAGSVWTAVSRVSGFVRAAGIAAVLGATYLGNTFVALNSLPNLVYYQLLAGSL